MTYLQKMSALILLGSFLWADLGYAGADPPLPTPIGRVVWITGTLTALMPNKEERKLQRLSVIYLHDTLITDASSKAQIVFTDNTLMSFRPSSKFYIKDYSFEPKNKKGSFGKSIMNLIEGGFRTITGLIAKDNPDHYQINTPVATIGVRGTDYIVVLKNGELFVGYFSGRPCVTSKSKKGKITTLCLDEKNQYVKVDSIDQVPTPLSQKPDVFDEELEIIPAKISMFNTGGSSNGGITNFCITQ